MSELLRASARKPSRLVESPLSHFAGDTYTKTSPPASNCDVTSSKLVFTSGVAVGSGSGFLGFVCCVVCCAGDGLSPGLQPENSEAAQTAAMETWIIFIVLERERRVSWRSNQ